MRIAIAGSTGLVGRQVVRAATAAGHDVVELAREHGVDLTSPEGIAERLDGVAARTTCRPTRPVDPAMAMRMMCSFVVLGHLLSE
jgi:uncharacterized protein YbjT (DUF2867 family)